MEVMVMFSSRNRSIIAIFIIVTLVISFTAGLSLYVTAVDDYSWDLSNFITGIDVRDQEGAVVGDGVYYYGTEYTFAITFTEGLGSGKAQFEYNEEGFLIYQLPTQIIGCGPAADSEITVKGNKVIGLYSISEEGRVEVRIGNYNNQGDDA